MVLRVCSPRAPCCPPPLGSGDVEIGGQALAEPDLHARAKARHHDPDADGCGDGQLQRHHRDGGAIQVIEGFGHPEPGGEGARARSRPPARSEGHRAAGGPWRAASLRPRRGRRQGRFLAATDTGCTAAEWRWQAPGVARVSRWATVAPQRKGIGAAVATSRAGWRRACPAGQ